jgi:hypothetical protein
MMAQHANGARDGDDTAHATRRATHANGTHADDAGSDTRTATARYRDTTTTMARGCTSDGTRLPR